MKALQKDLLKPFSLKIFDPSLPLIALLGILVLTVFVIAGGHNTDEGWYLAASEKIFNGYTPFRDFAFTQMPLLPYAYLPAIVVAKAASLPILLTSRFESAFFCIVSGWASIKIASRIGGKQAAVISLLLISISFSSLYFMAIVKTYSLLSALFSLSILSICPGKKNSPNYLLSSFFIILASCTRLSVLPSAAVLITYSFFRLIKLRRLASALVLIIGLSFAAAVFFQAFVALNPDTFLWGIIKHHSDQWAGQSSKLLVIAKRLFRLFVLTYVFVLTVFYLVATKGGREIAPRLIQVDISDQLLMPSIASSLLIFVLANSISGGFHLEYFAPVVFPLIATYSYLISRIATSGVISQRFLRYIVLISAATVVSLNAPALARISVSQRFDPGKIRSAAEVIRFNSSDNDNVFAMEALMPVLEARRELPNNATMSWFSFYPEMDPDLSKTLHLISDQDLIDRLKQRSSELVLLTDWDFEKMYGSAAVENPIQGNLEAPSKSREIRLALESNYFIVKKIDGYGQFRSALYVYKVDK